MNGGSSSLGVSVLLPHSVATPVLCRRAHICTLSENTVVTHFDAFILMETRQKLFQVVLIYFQWSFLPLLTPECLHFHC